MEEPYYSIKEAARLTGLSYSQMQRLIKQGRCRYRRAGIGAARPRREVSTAEIGRIRRELWTEHVDLPALPSQRHPMP